ncbi:AAA family ATPase [Pedobacter sp. PLR]|uniref:AAA family ATPase n=1 Tax=Pedobacter sp. PLR TaxID=2994465 RepID=UPI00224663A3|nr:AAA family ATPase [Pedobacter sp. PLR]MCX2450064.1 AAA family ATPase [Pedobacter sp. PLR]
MPIIRQQVLQNIEFTQLKSLVNLNIDFSPHPITGIFGVNGSGKSSIIHALLAIYKPGDQDATRKDYKFSTFFTPTTHTTWLDSAFKITHTFRQDQTLVPNATRLYSKVTNRWNPRYTNRPERGVYFVGLNSCVPAIELERRESIISLTTALLNDALSILIRDRAGYIMNRDYQEYNQHTTTNKQYIGLRHNNISYSSLSMGAGEQRIFKILDTIFRAQPYSLIIIDEIDLTLHTDALNRLIDVLKTRATEKNLQIVFTSHREELAKRIDINIRHIFQTGTNTLCFNATNPDCISRLTGIQQRPIDLFVEDDLAEAITRKVVEELRIVRHCSIKRIGAAVNSFPLAMGMHLKGENIDNISVFIDGDIYTTHAEKITQMAKVYSGTEPTAVQRRNEAISCIRQFDLPEGTAPETFINNSIRALNDGSEIVDAAIAINAVLDKHHYVSTIVERLGYPKQLGLAKVVETFSGTAEWTNYTLPLRTWLESRIIALNME